MKEYIRFKEFNCSFTDLYIEKSSIIGIGDGKDHERLEKNEVRTVFTAKIITTNHVFEVEGKIDEIMKLLDW